jgi:hypothetical protein
MLRFLTKPAPVGFTISTSRDHYASQARRLVSLLKTFLFNKTNWSVGPVGYIGSETLSNLCMSIHACSFLNYDHSSFTGLSAFAVAFSTGIHLLSLSSKLSFHTLLCCGSCFLKFLSLVTSMLSFLLPILVSPSSYMKPHLLEIG